MSKGRRKRDAIGPERIEALFDEWLETEAGSARAEQLEARLSDSDYGRRLLEIHLGLRSAEIPQLPPGASAAVMRRLPDWSPAELKKLGEIVLRAWQDPVLRRELRAAPVEALLREGVRIPEGCSVRVASAEHAPFPSSREMVVPLPDIDSPILDAKVARRLLSDTEWSWLWGAPGPDASTADIALRKQRAPEIERQGKRWRRRAARLRHRTAWWKDHIAAWKRRRPELDLRRPLAYVAAAVAAVLLVFALSPLSRMGTALAGQSLGPGGSVFVAAGGGAAILLAIRWWLSRR